MLHPNALPELVEASGPWVTTSRGERLLDLVNGFGAVFLGHGDARVQAAAHAQIDRLWTAGRLPTPALNDAMARAQDLVPPGLAMAGIYSTGMEAMEFALRVAARVTGRQGLVGFARSMHGKSALAAGLAWPQAPMRPGSLHTLPFVDAESPQALLQRLATVLAPGDVAAVVVEPIQGSNGGHAVDVVWLDAVRALCHEHGSLLVMDEILTGLFRTGPAFVASDMARSPDLLVFGKCMANGLPVAAVALDKTHSVPASALPGSTFAGNAVVAAASAATLGALAMPATGVAVAALQSAWQEAFAAAAGQGLTVRGRGALVLVELADEQRARSLEAALRTQQIWVAGSGRWIRLLPSLACTPALLHDACLRLSSCARDIG